MRFLIIALLAVACQRAHTPAPVAEAKTVWAEADQQAAIAAGQKVIAKHQCTRCHVVDGLAGVGRPFDCVSCHAFMKGLKPEDKQYQEIASRYGESVLQRYQHNIQHLLGVPDLTSVAKRIRPDWIAGFLAAPQDLRPFLDESMIRNQLSPDERQTLVSYFAAVADVPVDAGDVKFSCPSPDRIAKGKARFEKAACTTCHVLGDTAFATKPAGALPLAPDLRFARERMRPDVMARWIQDPKSVWANATMPAMGLSKDDANLVRDFVMCQPVELPPTPEADTHVPPPTTADVSWEQVKEKVFGHVCVHCHMNDHEKDTGPGNLGGLGYTGKGLAMRTYEMLVRGAVGPDGKRYSVLQALPGEELPRIVQVLIARRVENRRDRQTPGAIHQVPDFGSGLLGMPLGLPALTDEDIGLVRRWLDEGCPGPTTVSGMKGISDGFLVPDGPVTKNQGCEVREPEEPPPAWATRPPRATKTP